MRRSVRLFATRASGPVQQVLKTQSNRLPYGVLAAGVATTVGSLVFLMEEKNTVKEPNTSCSFPTTEEGGELILTGTGARYKYGWFAVYAYAFYCSPSDFQGDENTIFDRLIRSEKPRLLRLTFQRDITGDDLRSALDESLKPRVGDDVEGQKQLLEFFGTFKNLSLKQNTSLVFAFGPQGRLETQFQGKTLTVIQSPAVARALLDVYLGASPISSDFKPSVLKNLAAHAD